MHKTVLMMINPAEEVIFSSAGFRNEKNRSLEQGTQNTFGCRCF